MAFEYLAASKRLFFSLAFFFSPRHAPPLLFPLNRFTTWWYFIPMITMVTP